MLQVLSYEEAQAITEDDHAAVHLINSLLEAHHQGQAPMQAMGLPVLRNAVKNPIEVQRAARLFYRYLLLGVSPNVVHERVSAFFLPVAMAMVSRMHADAQNPEPESGIAWTEHLDAAVERLTGMMYPGFLVTNRGVVRAGERDGHGSERLMLGVTIMAMLNNVHQEMVNGEADLAALGALAQG